VVSELVTNASRYAGGPIELRLIRDRVLLCEVTDPNNAQPPMRRAKITDEGGQGLYIVAQCTTRWCCRYGCQGKTIWTEQPLADGGGPFTVVLDAFGAGLLDSQCGQPGLRDTLRKPGPGRHGISGGCTSRSSGRRRCRRS